MAAGTRNGDCIPEGTNKSSEEMSTHGRKRHHGDAEEESETSCCSRR